MRSLTKIADIVKIRAGYTFRSTPAADVHGTTLLVQQRSVNESRTAIDFGSALRFAPERDCSGQLLHEEDVLFMGKGHSIFACPVASPPEPAVAVGLFFVLTLKHAGRVLPHYLAWVLNLRSTREQLLMASGSGVTMPVVRRGVLEDLTIPLPALAIQQQIVDLNQLMVAEKSLMHELTEQREILIAAVCHNMIGKS